MRTRTLCLLIAGQVAFAQPAIFTEGDLQRVESTARRYSWAQDVRSQILRFASTWPQDHLTRYGLSELAVPAEGGQWTLWYVCPTHGVSLQYQAPATHRCPVDNRTYSGWPYDQVILSRRHSDLAVAARDLALAYRMSGERRYGEAALWILNRYAELYLTYPHKDVNNRANTRSGARASAQTLDESVWLIPLAWAYDSLAGTEVMNDTDRARIERGLLRAAVEVIQRNDAGISNWQSWHNAAIGAVGFALKDRGLVQEAIDGKSGFRFQMGNSVIGEGFWYEGAWSYHFYALDPIVQLAEMAARSDYNLWEDANLRGLFSAPLRLAFADGSLPAFNDSNSVSLFSSARLYESAFARLGDPLYAAVARRGSRGREALFFGVPELPAADLADLRSEVFGDAGFAVLRGPKSDHVVTMKFGPHGGGHGHYDKLGLVSFAQGGVLAVDPGTQSYAAPTHNTWDKVTVAHNTIVVDEKVQGEATGKLLWSEATGSYSAASAEAGPAYAGVRLKRTLLVTAEYAVDAAEAFAEDGKSHQFDWVYHNYGVLESELGLAIYSGFPQANGYQHLTENRSVSLAGDWQVRFDGRPVGAVNYGSVFAGTAAAKGTYQYSNEQASGGSYSGKLAYEFTGAGYMLYSSPLLRDQPEKTPEGLRLMVYGDGSGHRLALRINDATDERFVATVGVVNWTGWKQVEVKGIGTWQHYLGNNDGVVDLPIRTVGVEWTQVAGGSPRGAIYVDDFAVLYPDQEAALAADYELAGRSLRVWMLGEEGTTVVAGKGLGPNLLQPVPYVMARRKAVSAQYVGLLEPYRTNPWISEFRKDGDGWITVRGEGFSDRFRFSGEGVEGYERVTLGRLP
ncbi:MAG: heparinase II/III family protein [Acidobacteria bacterium]|nr:heparinase II/III family protein [Acidobacteriota bacterium]